MKKLFLILAALAALCTCGALCGTPEGCPEAGRKVIIRTPALSSFARCLHTIADAAAELADGFSVEQQPAEDGSTGDEFIIIITDSEA